MLGMTGGCYYYYYYYYYYSDCSPWLPPTHQYYVIKTYVGKMRPHVNSGSQEEHVCGCFCLGPLAFHGSAVGAHLSLSRGRTLAHRKECTFDHGLAFSSRPVRVGEKLRLQVKKRVCRWTGALRLGFTNVPPGGGRSSPQPPVAIPDLTNTAGHWANIVPEHFCSAGTILEVWVSHGGTVYCRMLNYRKLRHTLAVGVDLSKPLWAMLDIYGQTCAVLLLGSEKRKALWTRKSCPLNSPHVSMQPHQHHGLDPSEEEEADLKDLCQKDKSCVCYLRASERAAVCVVCMVQPASTTLCCGHRCLCRGCSVRVIQEFGTCPLCRQAI
ncbi:hypothetical protein CRUP_030993 [Coryphaenoides rupestris]|nr:hypothetical protein CRUP_030993 [Coryphaenoides rupestris]